jgi:aminoglycoside phosphotransferase (APT) family kinase protein
METELTGGNVTPVHRVGDTVRRATGPWSPAVHALLRHLEVVGFVGAPRFLGIDDQDRETLTFVDGIVPTGADPAVVTDEALTDVGRLLRELHAAVVGFRLPDGVTWHHRSLGGPQPHLVCHHDLAPRNTVFRDGRPVAFIDWDMACPEAPIHDVVHAAWQFVPLGTDETCRRQGWTEPPDRGRRLRLLLDGYGLPGDERIGFARKVAARMETSASGIEWLAANGHAMFVKLAARGVPTEIRRDRDWVLANAHALDRAIHR